VSVHMCVLMGGQWKPFDPESNNGTSSVLSTGLEATERALYWSACHSASYR